MELCPDPNYSLSYTLPSVFQKDSNEWDKEITFWNQTKSCYRPLMLMLYMSVTLTQLNRTEQRISFLEKF